MCHARCKCALDFGSAASMIFSACRSALLFPAARGFCLDTQTIVRAICECVTKQDCIHARAGRDDVARSRLNIE
jgi:hypothetical protein